MAGRIAAATDYTALDSLFSGALVTARAGWPTTMYGSPPAWGSYRVYVSTDAQGIRFGITTRDSKVMFQPRTGDAIQLDEENWLYIGPRAGLTASQNITATEECVRAWVNDCRLRGKPDSTVLFGTVPTNWNANFMAIYTTAVGCQRKDLKAGEWPGPAAMTILYDTVINWDLHLKAQGQ